MIPKELVRLFLVFVVVNGNGHMAMDCSTTNVLCYLGVSASMVNSWLFVLKANHSVIPV